MRETTQLARDDFFWALAAACRVYGVAFDPALLAQQSPPPHSIASLRLALESLGMKVGVANAAPDALTSLALPCLVLVRDGERQALALLLQASRKQITILKPASTEAAVLDVDSFAGTVVQFSHGEPAVPDPDGAGKQAFGFGWFVPELLKYKSIWRDVLIASLALQLVGLATPLFTQVVIDKVVVNHTINTLWVVGVALAMFVVFTTVMTWMRQYLVVHSGNRVDAVLGQAVFRHLLRLPMPYKFVNSCRAPR